MDAHRLASLMDAQAAALVLYARSWCASAEDVVQDAFVKLAAQHTVPDDPVAWLYRVVRNGALSMRRADSAGAGTNSGAARSPAWFLPSEGAGLDQASVTEALRHLDADLREALIAHLWGGLTFEQVGALTNTSSSTAHRRYLAGLDALRLRLAVPCPNEPRT